MILRRLIEHVKAQHWTAVFLDFVIVVAGVFIGIQVSNWNAAKQEHRREALILDRLASDFRTIETDAQEAVAFHKRSLDGLQTVVEALHDGVLTADKEASFRNGLRYSYLHRNATERSGTFIEILSSGQVAMIRNEALRTALIDYDNNVLESEQVFMQIRMHQSAYVAAFTLRYDYEVPAQPIDTETGVLPYQPVGAFDFAAMLADPAFKNAAQEMRETNRYYYSWHLRNLKHARTVLALLDRASQESKK
ncbi:MAG: DUF6090 family protein [Parvularculaceae bacterium]